MKVCITIDVEHDCPPWLTTYRGIEEGMPRLLGLFRDEGTPATFFTTGDVARRYPDVLRELVAAGHELASHGDSHRRFGQMDMAEARDEIRAASATLRAFYPVSSFRAPNLDFPAEYLPLLVEDGYRVDSSEGRHKHGFYFARPRVRRESGMWRVPASISPSPMRAPAGIPELICRVLDSPAVPFYHPWDFIDMSRTPIRIDCRIWSGDRALHHLRRTIRHFKRRGADFHRMNDLPLAD